MSSYLLTWNPEKWSQEELEEYYERYQNDEVLKWSCGNTKKIIPGDDFYLLQQGKYGSGIIGFGKILSSPFYDKHYDEDKAVSGKHALFIDVKFHYLQKPGTSVLIEKYELQNIDPECKIWNAQGSGKTIPFNIERKISELLNSRVDLEDFKSPEEMNASSLSEGARKSVIVNAYERNPEARRKCLEKWGYNCSVCNFHFELFYGSVGKKYIHVHHLIPVSSIGQEYIIDPIKDLRPVCPNCHSMLHRENPPISIEELKKQVEIYGAK